MIHTAHWRVFRSFAKGVSVKFGSFLVVALVLGACSSPVKVPPISSADKELYALYLQRDYFTLETRLAGLDAKDPLRGFFEGQLDAAFLRDEQAAEKLQRFLDLPGTEHDWRKEAYLTLGDVALRAFAYETAALNLDKALREPSAQFTAANRRDTEQDLVAARALRNLEPQSRDDFEGPSTVNASRGSGGLLYVDVSVNGSTEQLLFDTGSEACVASETFARLHKLLMLPGQVQFTSSTGESRHARLGVASNVRIGKIALHSVVFGMVPDADLTIPELGMTDAIMGTPVLLALEHVRVAADGGSVEVGLPTTDAPPTVAASRNMAFYGSLPLVQLSYQGDSVPFLLDTGMNETVLYARFGRRFPGAVAGAAKQLRYNFGIGSALTASVQMPSQIELGVGRTPVTLRDAVVIQSGDELYGPPVFGIAGANLFTGGLDLDFRRLVVSLPGGDSRGPGSPASASPEHAPGR